MKCVYCNSENLFLISRTVRKGQYILFERFRCKDCGRSFSKKVKWEDALYLIGGTLLRDICKHAISLDDYTEGFHRQRTYCYRNLPPGEVPPTCKLQCCPFLVTRTSEGKVKVMRR